MISKPFVDKNNELIVPGDYFKYTYEHRIGENDVWMVAKLIEIYEEDYEVYSMKVNVVAASDKQYHSANKAGKTLEGFMFYKKDVVRCKKLDKEELVTELI